MRAARRVAALFSSHPLTRDRQLAAWLRFLSWQVKSRMTDESIVTWIAGQRLAVRRGMTGATGNIYVGLHEFTDMMLPLHFLREGDLFLDIGANVGSYTVLASGVCRARTWAFEPDPDTVRALARNVAINDLDPLVTIHEVALGDQEGEVRFTIGQETMNRVATDGDSNSRLVRVSRLDSIVGQEQPVFIKMDVEGYEETVLRGARAVLAKDSLNVIELETVTPQILSMLDESGFTRAYYDPFHRSLQREPVEVSSANAIFVKDWSLVSTRLKDAAGIEIFGRRI